MGRSVTARLEQLEAKSQQRRGVLEAEKEAQLSAVLERLSAEELDALEEMYTAKEEVSALWQEVERAALLSSGEGELSPEDGAAVRWVQGLWAVPQGAGYPLPPIGTAEQCKDLARYWSGAETPDGVSGATWQTFARWNAAQHRFFAVLADILLEDWALQAHES